MNPEGQRQQSVLALVRHEGQVRVEDLARRLSTTPQTIRKDLRVLESAGLITRFHGGAQLRAGREYLAYSTRARVATAAKQAIGSAALAALQPGMTVFLNAGTTTEALARALSPQIRLTVITDSAHIANILRVNESISVIVAGGAVRASDGAVVGAAAVAFLEQFRTDIAIIGAAAIGADGMMMDYDLDEVMVARTMMRNASDTLLLADGTKFNGKAPVTFGHVRDLSRAITDTASKETRGLFARNDVDLQVLSQRE